MKLRLLPRHFYRRNIGIRQSFKELIKENLMIGRANVETLLLT